jgi:hypothetical protein
MPTLRISSRTQIYADVVPGQLAEPLQRFCDFERFFSGAQAREVVSDRRVIDPGQTLTLANVPTVSGILSGALYSLTAHPTKQGRYQVRYTGGAISNPLVGLGTGLLTPANTYAVTLNTDGSVNISDTSVAPVNFGTLVARGDKVYVAGSNFGDTGPFSTLTQGFWTVVSFKAVGVNPGAMLIIKRIDPTDALGTAETVTAASAFDLQKVAPASSALIVGTSSYAGVWNVVESASGWLSIDSLSVLPDLTGVSLTALSVAEGQFLGYSRVEVDGLAIVSSKSGDLTQGQQVLRPVVFSDPLAVPVGGWAESYGFLTSLTVQNVSDRTLNVNVVLAYLVS